MAELLSDYSWDMVKGRPYATGSFTSQTPTTAGETSNVFDARGLQVLQATIATTTDEETVVQFEVAYTQDAPENEWQPLLGGRFKQTEGNVTQRVRSVHFHQIFPFLRATVKSFDSNATSGDVTIKIVGWA